MLTYPNDSGDLESDRDRTGIRATRWGSFRARDANLTVPPLRVIREYNPIVIL